MSTIQDYKDAWSKANAAGDQTGMNAAHSGAEAIRAQQGYSGGADGGQRVTLGGTQQTYAPSGSYMDSGLSAQDKAKVDAIKNQWNNANAAGDEAGKAAANAAAEAIRKGYGYSGGADGSEYNPYQTENPVKNPIISSANKDSYIDSLYAAQQQAALAKLKSAYDQNTIDLNATAEKIPGVYQNARNQTAATAEQNRAAFNERAAATGLNSGTGGQADLAMRNQNNANMSSISGQEAGAVKDLETTRLKLSTAYQNDIAQAIATGDLARAQALYQESVRVDESLVKQSQAQADENYRTWAAQNAYNQQQMDMQKQQADTLAAYGDFSGYSALGFTPEQISQMQAVWAAKNPLLAQAMGISNFSGGGGYKGGTTAPPKTSEPQFGDYTPREVDNPLTLKELSSKLATIEDKNVSVRSNALHAIQNYLNQGLISESTANKMISNYSI